MKSVTLKDFLEDVEGWCDIAEQQAVTIFEGGKAAFVLMPISDFNRLTARASKIAEARAKG